MAVIKGLEWTFDTVASKYEKWRPGYVKELYEKIFEYISLHADCNAVEVGIGGGQATLPILESGCALTAVEYGEHFSELCRKKYIAYPKFSVITGKFEDIDFTADTYDLVYSASAFHWVPEEIGYTKVYAMLKNGGAFARFANQPGSDKEKPELTEEIERLYDAYYYQFHKKKALRPKPFNEEQAMQRAKIAEKYGFRDILYYLFHRERVFSAAEYITLLGTYSDHIVIEENIRKEFFDKIEEAINKHGGSITIYDTIDLELARKVD